MKSRPTTRNDADRRVGFSQVSAVDSAWIRQQPWSPRRSGGRSLLPGGAIPGPLPPANSGQRGHMPARASALVRPSTTPWQPGSQADHFVGAVTSLIWGPSGDRSPGRADEVCRDAAARPCSPPVPGVAPAPLHVAPSIAARPASELKCSGAVGPAADARGCYHSSQFPSQFRSVRTLARVSAVACAATTGTAAPRLYWLPDSYGSEG